MTRTSSTLSGITPGLLISILMTGLLTYSSANAQEEAAPSQAVEQAQAEPQQEVVEEPVERDESDKESGSEVEAVPAALGFTMADIDGSEVDLSQYLGKVIVVVNTASRCGLTPQYEQLQALYNERGDDGLVVLGFPCSQFRNQELATEAAIKEFCTKNYGVTFGMFSKVEVNGANRCALYEHLCSQDLAPAGAGDIRWNFEKFVIDQTGTPIARFAPQTRVDTEEFMTVIDAALAEGSTPATNKVDFKLIGELASDSADEVMELLITADGTTEVTVEMNGECSVAAEEGVDIEAILNKLAEENEVFKGWERK